MLGSLLDLSDDLLWAPDSEPPDQALRSNLLAARRPSP